MQGSRSTGTGEATLAHCQQAKSRFFWMPLALDLGMQVQLWCYAAVRGAAGRAAAGSCGAPASRETQPKHCAVAEKVP